MSTCPLIKDSTGCGTGRLFESPAREPQAPVAESNKSRSRLQKHGWSYMASQLPPRSSDDMLLFALEQALREVLAVLKAHDPHEYLHKDRELQTASWLTFHVKSDH